MFYLYHCGEIKLAYKSSDNKHKHQVILLMINDEANNYYHFAIKNLPELNSLEWLQSKKDAIINNNTDNNNNNNNFRNALDDALNYAAIESYPQRITKLKLYINNYKWKGREFPAGSKNGKNLSKIIKQLHLIYYM